MDGDILILTAIIVLMVIIRGMMIGAILAMVITILIIGDIIIILIMGMVGEDITIHQEIFKKEILPKEPAVSEILQEVELPEVLVLQAVVSQKNQPGL